MINDKAKSSENIFKESLDLMKTGQVQESLDVLDQFIKHTDDQGGSEKSKALVGALLAKALVLTMARRLEDAISIYENIVEKYKTDEELKIHDLRANALINKIVLLIELKRERDAVSFYKENLPFLRATTIKEFKANYAMALITIASVLLKQEEESEAICALDEVAKKFGSCPKKLVKNSH